MWCVSKREGGQRYDHEGSGSQGSLNSVHVYCETWHHGGKGCRAGVQSPLPQHEAPHYQDSGIADNGYKATLSGPIAVNCRPNISDATVVTTRNST